MVLCYAKAQFEDGVNDTTLETYSDSTCGMLSVHSTFGAKAPLTIALSLTESPLYTFWSANSSVNVGFLDSNSPSDDDADVTITSGSCGTARECVSH